MGPSPAPESPSNLAKTPFPPDYHRHRTGHSYLQHDHGRDLIASFLQKLRRLQRAAGRQKQRRLLNIAQSPSGKAPDFDSGIRWFESNLGSHTTRLRISGASIRLRRNIYDENRVL